MYLIDLRTRNVIRITSRIKGNFNSVYQGTIRVRTCQMLLARFHDGDFSLNGRPNNLDHNVSKMCR